MEKLLEQLAAQLGTTTQYLWGVLIKQAPISALTDLLQYGLLALACYGCVRWWKWINARHDPGSDAMGHVIGCAITTTVVGCVLLVAFFSIGTTITAIVNPEYWALQKVLRAIGR